MFKMIRKSQRQNKGIPPARYPHMAVAHSPIQVAKDMGSPDKVQPGASTGDGTEHESNAQEIINLFDNEEVLQPNSLATNTPPPTNVAQNMCIESPLSVAVANMCSQLTQELQKELSIFLQQQASIANTQSNLSTISNSQLQSTSTLVHSQLPSTSTQMHNQLPSTSTYVHSQLPSTYTQMHNQLPSTSTYVHSQLPSTYTQMHNQLPSTSTYVHSQLPSTSTQMHNQLPSTSSQAHSQLPSTYTQMHNQLPPISSQAHSQLPSTSTQMHNQLPPVSNYVHTQLPPASTYMQSQISSSSMNTSYAKLIDLPNFDGDPMDWPIFERTFIDTTAEFGSTNMRNMIRLRKALTLNARAVVESLLPFPESVPQIMSTLKQNFGRPEQIINKSITKIRKMPVILAGDYNALISFANKVRNLYGFVKYVNLEYRLCDITLLTELVAKLPAELQMQWAESKEGKPAPSISLLGEFLDRIVKRVNVVQDSLSSVSVTGNQRFTGIQQQNKFTNKKHTFVAKFEGRACPFCENACNKPADCTQFKNISVKARWEKVKAERLCFGCLKHRHHISQCQNKNKCGTNGCEKYHNQLLHVINNSDEVSRSERVYNAEAFVNDSAVMF